MADAIKIEFNVEDIEGKTQDEKLTLLLKIAFANHTTLNQHGKILFGNGEQGICDRTRAHGKALIAMWTLMVGSIAGFASWMFIHLTGK